MASLAQTNKYLRDPKVLKRIISDDVRASALFEGASHRALKRDYAGSCARAKTASSKKRPKSA